MIAAHVPPHSLSELIKAFFSLSKNKDLKDDFENRVKKFLQTEYYQTTSSGRRALYIALKALGIGKGDEVIIPAFTTNIVPLVVRETGATVVPADVKLDDYNIDPTSVVDCISSKTKAIMAVHTFGCPVDISKIKDICLEYDLFFVENAAQAFGAKYNGRYVSTFGDISIMSFGFGKSISMGTGGGIVVSNGKLFKKIQSKSKSPNNSIDIFVRLIGSIILSNPTLYGILGYRFKDNMVFHQYNSYKEEVRSQYDIPVISYAIGVQELKRNIFEKRRKIAIFYNNILKKIENIYPQKENKNVRSVYTRYFIRVESENLRNDFCEKMKNLKIEPLLPNHGYPISDTLYPIRLKDDIPNSNLLSKTLIGIPVHVNIGLDKLEQIFGNLKVGHD